MRGASQSHPRVMNMLLAWEQAFTRPGKGIRAAVPTPSISREVMGEGCRVPGPWKMNPGFTTEHTLHSGQ